MVKIIEALKTLNKLTISTNDVLIASTLSGIKKIFVLVIGGVLRSGYYTLTGFLAENLLRDLTVDCAFIGGDAISPDGNVMITNTEEVGIKRLAIKAASQVIVLCDHTKFNNTALVHVTPLDKIDKIITDKDINNEVLEKLKEYGLEVLY